MIETIDLARYIERGKSLDDCRRLAYSLAATSVVIVRDPRVESNFQLEYRRMLDEYFRQPREVLQRDGRPEHHWQVGISTREQPRDHRALIANLPLELWPHIPPLGHEDDRYHFMRRVGPRPAHTKFPALNAPDVVPAGFEGRWERNMDRWGAQMLASVETIAEMLALAYNLPPNTFTKHFRYAPHLLAPNGVVLDNVTLGQIFNAFHYDFNWGTIHGAASYPGLRIWLRDWQPLVVRVPPGCLLFQVGKQLEWQSGGYLRAGFHEVVALPEMLAALKEVRAQRGYDRSQVKVRSSSTVFVHVASDRFLQVHGHFLRAHPPAVRRQILRLYPRILAGEMSNLELEAIGFKD
ncbi:MAG: hypothetical protein Q7K39_00515 [Candidatus Magasanikbacteria bacterium]|nr:hypothetical protein [Candidatus Magasanikbacteria bacterium]